MAAQSRKNKLICNMKDIFWDIFSCAIALGLFFLV